MTPAERAAWARDLRAAADRLDFVGSVATVHRLAQVRCHLHLVADLLEQDADEGRVVLEVLAEVGRFLADLGESLRDGILSPEEHVHLWTGWHAVQAVVEGLIGPPPADLPLK